MLQWAWQRVYSDIHSIVLSLPEGSALQWFHYYHHYYYYFIIIQYYRPVRGSKGLVLQSNRFDKLIERDL